MDYLTIGLERAADCTVVRLSGRLSMRTVPETRGALTKAMLNSPCVLVDLAELELMQDICAQVFPAALEQAGNWPWSKLALFGAAPVLDDALRSCRITSTVPLSVDRDAAWLRIQRRPDLVRLTRKFGTDPMQLRAVRATVVEVATAWGLPEWLRADAELLANELVTNAMEHAGTESRLTIDLGRRSLTLRVRDYFPARVPRLRSHDPSAMRGRGMQLIESMARSWGIERHPDGKTVWARLDADPTTG